MYILERLSLFENVSSSLSADVVSSLAILNSSKYFLVLIVHEFLRSFKKHFFSFSLISSLLTTCN